MSKRQFNHENIPYPPNPLIPTEWGKGEKPIFRRGFSPSLPLWGGVGVGIILHKGGA
jgi:hypothetical protein